MAPLNGIKAAGLDFSSSRDYGDLKKKKLYDIDMAMVQNNLSAAISGQHVATYVAANNGSAFGWGFAGASHGATGAGA